MRTCGGAEKELCVFVMMVRSEVETNSRINAIIVSVKKEGSKERRDKPKRKNGSEDDDNDAGEEMRRCKKTRRRSALN